MTGKADEERMIDIVQRIIDTIPHDQQMEMVKNDGRLQAIHRDMELHRRQKKFVEAGFDYQKMRMRTNELVTQIAQKKCIELIENGDIVFFMDEPDREKFNAIRGKIALVSDVLDSAYHDMEGMLNSLGFQGHVKAIKEVVAARQAIEKWGRETLPVMQMESIKPLFLDEADNIYEYVGKRLPVLQRKVDRILIKQETKK